MKCYRSMIPVMLADGPNSGLLPNRNIPNPVLQARSKQNLISKQNDPSSEQARVNGGSIFIFVRVLSNCPLFHLHYSSPFSSISLSLSLPLCVLYMCNFLIILVLISQDEKVVAFEDINPSAFRFQFSSFLYITSIQCCIT